MPETLWIARDKGAPPLNTPKLFFTKPVKWRVPEGWPEMEVYWIERGTQHVVRGPGRPRREGRTLPLKLPDLKPGECRRYTLVGAADAR